MSPETTLIQLRHQRDLLSVLRTDGPWVRSAEGAEGLTHALLTELVGRRDRYPVQLTDRAFTTADDLGVVVGAPRGCDALAVDAALRELEAARMVESCGRAVGHVRWRATQQAMLAQRSLQLAA